MYVNLFVSSRVLFRYMCTVGVKTASTCIVARDATIDMFLFACRERHLHTHLARAVKEIAPGQRHLYVSTLNQDALSCRWSSHTLLSCVLEKSRAWEVPLQSLKLTRPVRRCTSAGNRAVMHQLKLTKAL